MSRVKATDKVSFPLEMDMTSLVTPTVTGAHSNGHTSMPGGQQAGSSAQDGHLPAHAGPGHMYDLAAILIHKGGSATSGHYGTCPAPPSQLCMRPHWCGQL